MGATNSERMRNKFEDIDIIGITQIKGGFVGLWGSQLQL